MAKKYTADEVLQMLQQVGGVSNKAISPSVGDTHDAALFHGSDGVWGTDAILEREVLSAIAKPTGLLEKLPVVADGAEIRRYGTISGWTPRSDVTEPNYPCENAPRGTYSTCRLEFGLGSIKRDTNTIQVDKAIDQYSRADGDFQLRGRLLNQALQENGISFGGVDGNALNVPDMLEIHSMANYWLSELSYDLWNGDPAGDPLKNTIGEGRTQFKGFKLLVDDGIQDAVTSAACPTMNSSIYDFNFGEIATDTLTLGNQTYNLFQLLELAERTNFWLADSTGLTPFNGYIVFTPELWHVFSELAPFMWSDRGAGVYGNTNVTTGSTVLQLNADTDAKRQQTIALRNSRRLELNGREYQVVLDWQLGTLENSDNALITLGNYASDVYFIPTSVMGGLPTTWLRHRDYRGIQSKTRIGNMFQYKPYAWTDDGRFLMAREEVNFCYEYTVKGEFGLVMRTPQLAWAVKNIQYSIGEKLRSGRPQDYTNGRFIHDVTLTGDGLLGT